LIKTWFTLNSNGWPAACQLANILSKTVKPIDYGVSSLAFSSDGRLLVLKWTRIAGSSLDQQSIKLMVFNQICEIGQNRDFDS
jgi:hypothetical protein